MSITFYKILHLAAALSLFAVLGGVLMTAANGIGKEKNRWRKKAAIIHGVGLLILFVSGFGLLAKNGLAFPAWAIIKMVLWLILGALLPFAYRQARRATTSGDNAVNEKAGDLLWWLLLGVGFLAAYVGVSWRGW